MDLIRILIVDDQTLFRQSLASMLQASTRIEVVGEAGDGCEAIEMAGQLVPDIVLMDIRMPRCGGLEATRAILKENPSISVIVLTISDKDHDLFAAIKMGARGYLLKTVDAKELVQAIELVAGGHVVISPFMASKLMAEFNSVEDTQIQQAQAAGTLLTDREKDVLRLLAQGASNRQIADTLFIAESTVKTHLRNILHKLHLHNRVQAAIFAVQEGLVEDGADQPT